MILRFLAAISFAVFCFSGAVLAQQQQQDQAGTLLPDINPQDIEIRGDFQARFPGLSRQPILGFNPRPRVFQVDPNRMPYIESADEIVATVSISDLEQPLTPETDPIIMPDRHHTFARLGFGRFTSPEASIQHERSIAENRYLIGDLNVHNSQGHLDDWDSGFLRSNLDVSYLSYQNNGTFRADMGFMFDQTDMPDNRSDPESFYFDDHNALSFNTGISYTQQNSAFDGFSTSLSYRYFVYSMDLNCDFYTSQCGLLDIAYPRESVNQLEASLYRFISGSRMDEVWHIQSDWDFDKYDNTHYTTNDGSVSRLGSITGLGYERRINYALRGKLRADVLYTYHDSDHEFRIRPGLWAEYAGLGNTKVTFDARAYVKNHTAYNNYLINPFSFGVSDNRPETGFSTDLNIEYNLFEGLTLYADNTLDYFDNGNAFVFDISSNKIYTQSISSGWRLSNRVGGAYDFIPYNVTLSAEVSLHNGEASIEETSELPSYTYSGVPDTSPFQIHTSIFANPFANFYVKAWLDILNGNEYIHMNRSNTSFEREQLSSHALLNLQLDYRVSSNFGLYLKGLNLMNQEYEVWKGYQERPLQIYGGVTIRL